MEEGMWRMDSHLRIRIRVWMVWARVWDYGFASGAYGFAFGEYGGKGDVPSIYRWQSRKSIARIRTDARHIHGESKRRSIYFRLRFLASAIHWR